MTLASTISRWIIIHRQATRLTFLWVLQFINAKILFRITSMNTCLKSSQAHIPKSLYSYQSD